MKFNQKILAFYYLLSFSIASLAATPSIFKPVTEPSNTFLQEVGKQFSVYVGDLENSRSLGPYFQMSISNDGNIPSTISSIVINDKPDAIVGFYDMQLSEHWAFETSPFDNVVRLSSINEGTANGFIDWGLHNSSRPNDQKLTSLSLVAGAAVGPDDFLPREPMSNSYDFFGFVNPGKTRMSFTQGASPMVGITLFVHDIPGFENQNIAFEFTGIPAPVPEPETFAMLLAGLLVVALGYRKAKKVTRRSTAEPSARGTLENATNHHPPICLNGSNAKSINLRCRTTISATAVIP